VDERAGAGRRRSLDGQQARCFACGSPLADALGGCTHVDGGGTSGLVGVGDVLERVVAGDRQRTCATLI